MSCMICSLNLKILNSLQSSVFVILFSVYIYNYIYIYEFTLQDPNRNNSIKYIIFYVL